MSTASKSRHHHFKLRQKMVHADVCVTEKRRHEYQVITMKTSISAEQLGRLALKSMEAITHCNPQQATFSEI